MFYEISCLSTQLLESAKEFSAGAGEEFFTIARDGFGVGGFVVDYFVVGVIVFGFPPATLKSPLESHREQYLPLAGVIRAVATQPVEWPVNDEIEH